MLNPPLTMFDKVWNSHIVFAPAAEPALLYIDLHLLHKVSSPQAFDGLRAVGRRVRAPQRCLATIDHAVPTTSDRTFNILDPIAAHQIAALQKNCADFGIQLLDIASPEQGIVHVIGPELGATSPA